MAVFVLVQGVSHRYCTVVQRGAGYGYSLVAKMDVRGTPPQRRDASHPALYLPRPEGRGFTRKLMNDRISAVASTLAATAAGLDIVDIDDDESVQQILNYYKLQTVSGWETTPSQWVEKKAVELRNPSILL